MRKLIFFAIALLTSLVSQAITVEEAFKKISALPGAAVSDMPSEDVSKEGLEYGKVAILLGQNADKVIAIKDEVSDAAFYETNVEGFKTYVISQPGENGTERTLFVTLHSIGPVCVLGKGPAEAVQNIVKN